MPDKTMVKDLEEFALIHIIRPYQTAHARWTTTEEAFKTLPVTLEELARYPDLYPAWWKLVKTRLDEIGFEFPPYINHPLVFAVKKPLPLDGEELKKGILNLSKTAVSDLMYYDRRECEDVPRGTIEEAVKTGLITKEEIVQAFDDKLAGYLEE